MALNRKISVVGLFSAVLVLVGLGLPSWAAPNLPEEQIFGAELQYFRLRGGQGMNIPASDVYATWARALDAAKAARMNMISFYIPWDFHEYKEGHFDFDGTADEDGDGRADYPSRDLKTFFRMIEERGFQHVMVRPGPYINAEWGFLGFGAIPLWFHEKYPNSHMRNAQGLRTKLYDYHNPDLLRHTELWFQQVNQQIIRPSLAKSNLIKFVQVDNETNFMWQSIYNCDYSPQAVLRYQEFLKKRYSSLNDLNAVHKQNWTAWSQILPPVSRGANLGEDQDWYRFQDQSIFEYLQNVRAIWERLGVREPQVLFTVAESYNAAGSGLIPNHILRNHPTVGLLTVNLYPKTYETPRKPFLNNPFKSDHDVIAQASASEFYLGAGNQYVMGPEIQGGWWKGIDVSTPARRQTYLSTLGHGMKALLVYYFHEGQNWQTDWAKEQITPYYQELRSSMNYRGIAESQLPNVFWKELQAIVDREILVGFDARLEMTRDHAEAAELFFDAPLDGRALPRGHFADLKKIGEQVMAPHGAWLGKANSDFDSVCLLKDVADHVPNANFDYVALNTDWESGLIGYALNAGLYMRIHHWGIQAKEDLNNCKIIIRQDNGRANPEMARVLESHVKLGNVVVNLLNDSMAQDLGMGTSKTWVNKTETLHFSNLGKMNKFEGQAVFQFEKRKDCTTVLAGEQSEIYGYQCALGTGRFYQLSAQFYGVFNTDDYAHVEGISERTEFLRVLYRSVGGEPKIEMLSTLGKQVPRVVSFARTVPGRPERWITVKNGNQTEVTVNVKWNEAELNRVYRVRDLLNGNDRDVRFVRGNVLRTQGIPLRLNAIGSTVLWIEADWAGIAR